MQLCYLSLPLGCFALLPVYGITCPSSVLGGIFNSPAVLSVACVSRILRQLCWVPADLERSRGVTEMVDFERNGCLLSLCPFNPFLKTVLLEVSELFYQIIRWKICLWLADSHTVSVCMCSMVIYMRFSSNDSVTSAKMDTTQGLLYRLGQGMPTIWIFDKGWRKSTKLCICSVQKYTRNIY